MDHQPHELPTAISHDGAWGGSTTANPPFKTHAVISCHGSSESFSVSQIERAVQGDGDALTTLLLTHGPAVERRLHIDRRWRSRIEPLDVMQVTYLEAFLNIQRFNATTTPTDDTSPRQVERAFFNWLRRMAENNLRDAIRGICGRRCSPAQDLLGSPQEAETGANTVRHQDLHLSALSSILGVCSATPSRDCARDESGELLRHALDRLPEDYQRVVRLYDLEGLPIAEVCARMGRRAGAIHMLRARAHDRLREALGSPSQFFSSVGGLVEPGTTGGGGAEA